MILYLLSSRDLSYLASRDELQGAESDLQVGGVGLEVVESLSDVGLELRGVLPRGAVGGDLVKGGHLDWLAGRCRLVEVGDDGVGRLQQERLESFGGFRKCNWGFCPCALCGVGLRSSDLRSSVRPSLQG